MKKHITKEQLQELSDKGKERLRDWWKPDVGHWISPDGKFVRLIVGFDGEWITNSKDRYERYSKQLLPILSIGQMIEFLDDNNKWDIYITQRGGRALWQVYLDKDIQYSPFNGDTLVDALWEPVKTILEMEDKPPQPEIEELDKRDIEKWNVDNSLSTNNYVPMVESLEQAYDKLNEVIRKLNSLKEEL